MQKKGSFGINICTCCCWLSWGVEKHITNAAGFAWLITGNGFTHYSCVCPICVVCSVIPNTHMPGYSAAFYPAIRNVKYQNWPAICIFRLLMVEHFLISMHYFPTVWKALTKSNIFLLASKHLPCSFIFFHWWLVSNHCRFLRNYWAVWPKTSRNY